MRFGGVVVPINSRLAPAEMSKVLAEADARVVIAAPQQLTVLPAVTPGFDRDVVGFDSKPDKTTIRDQYSDIPDIHPKLR